MIYLEKNLQTSINKLSETMLLILPSTIRRATSTDNTKIKYSAAKAVLYICYNAIKDDIIYCFTHGDLEHDAMVKLVQDLERKRDAWADLLEQELD